MSNLVVLDTAQGLKNVMAYLEDAEYIAFDTETTGVHKGAEIIGFSVCAQPEVAYYLILSKYDCIQQKLVEQETAPLAKEFFKALMGKKLIAHNAVFDCSKINDIYGVDLMPSLHTDTMVLSHLLDETRRAGLKELGRTIFGEDATQEQDEMKASVTANGGSLTKDNYELWKGDAQLIGRYGAKDALLTYNLFCHFVPILIEQGLDGFFYDDESMPLLRGPTYELNTSGLQIDMDRLKELKAILSAEIVTSQHYIETEIRDIVKDKYPGTKKANTFNVNAGQQLAWLLFEQLGEDFISLTDGGRELAKSLRLNVYTEKGRREFKSTVAQFKGQVWMPKGPGVLRDKTIGDPWQYMCSDADVLENFSKKYKWVEALLKQKKNLKLLNTYVEGIQEKIEYGIIRPSFSQIGTTSGRYSSFSPNFQTLPRDDKRIKAFVVSRPKKVFVGADYSQLEPRVFASVSQDKRLLECFAKGEDFYSVVGAPIFGITDCSLFKDDENSFANKHKGLRSIAKQFALATAYGTTASRQAEELGKSKKECQDIIDKYFSAYPQVEAMMLTQHEEVKAKGVVHSLYGRPRRIPEAMNIPKSMTHSDLPYDQRNHLNLGMNHKVQSSAASIVNRAAIAFHKRINELSLDARIVLQVHDELVIECLESDGELVSEILRDCMENTTVLPGVKLVANPVIAKDLASLK